MKHRLTVSVATLTLLIIGWSVTRGMAQSGMGMHDNQMSMMQKMMMDRPASLKKADATVAKVKAEATKKGMYTCCLKHPCDWCALKMGSCPCGKNAAMNMPVCNECKGGWEAGDGAIGGKTAADIKTFPRGGMAMGMAMPASTGKTIIVRTCPMTGEKVIGAGAGMERVANYEVHFCCSDCQPMFDKLTKAQKIQKIKAVLKQS